MKKNCGFHNLIASSFFFTLTILLLNTFLFTLEYKNVSAQDQIPPGVTPQKVTGVFRPVSSSNSSGVYQTINGSIDFWNVGELGGVATRSAIVTMNFYWDDEGTVVAKWEYIFSGGPDGFFSLISGPTILSGSPGEIIQRSLDDPEQVWIPKGISYQEDEVKILCGVTSGPLDTPWFEINDCSPFAGWFTKGSDCNAEMTWDANLKAGDVLSPVLTFKGPDGQIIPNIGQALYINGQETWSTIWDGKQANLELQYTCPDHIGHVLTMTVPAAGIAPPPANPPANQNTNPTGNQNTSPITPPQKTSPSSLEDLLKIILVGIGITSIGTTIAVVTRLKSTAGSQTKSIIHTEHGDSIKTVKEKPKLDPKKRDELIRKRAEFESKWKEIRNEITNRERQHLRVMRINTSNRFKSMFKQGMEAKSTVTGPISKVLGEGFKKVSGIDLDKMLFDLDNQKDVGILVKGKECQQALKLRLDQLKQELKSTAKEIGKINEQLVSDNQ